MSQSPNGHITLLNSKSAITISTLVEIVVIILYFPFLREYRFVLMPRIQLILFIIVWILVMFLSIFMLLKLIKIKFEPRYENFRILLILINSINSLIFSLISLNLIFGLFFVLNE
jgi:hypothetical protein